MQTIRIGMAILLFALGVLNSPGQTPAPAPANPADTQEMLRAYKQVQEQLHAVQSTMENHRRDAEDIAARNVKALGERLNAIEQSVGSQRSVELQALQSSNRFMLIITGALVLLGVVVVLFTYLQWRAMHRLTEVALGLQVQQQLGAGRSPAFIEAGEPRLVSVIERLEKRIRELEQGNHLPLPSGEAAHLTNGQADKDSSASLVATTSAMTSGQTDQVTLLLSKGQSLMSIGQNESAVAVFDEILALEPANTEALVKKGTALEKMEKLKEAVECYDRAIEADKTVTIAYLYKGGVFNRMERYNEALECYEKALKTQEKAAA